MAETAESLATVIAPAKQDWKAVATLALSALLLLSGLTWVVTGQILRGAQRDLQENTAKIAAIESKQAVYDQKVVTTEKRIDECLAELKLLSQKVNGVAESQARMEGFMMGKK